MLLIRNHEVNGSTGAYTTDPSVPVYDTAARGGNTYVLVDLQGNVERTWPALAGTQMNCAGGPTLWRSWIACEETVNGPDVFDDFTRNIPLPTPPNPETTYMQNPRLQRTHGYIFEVPVDGAASAEPVTHAGRFAHEAAVADPIIGSIYLTEDNFGFGSGLYRYDPPVHPLKAKRIVDGGKLWMLGIKGTPQANLSGNQVRGTRYRVRWIRIPIPNPQFPMAGGVPTVTNNQAISNVGKQGWDGGGAVFSRLEGIVLSGGVVYFTATQGGGDPEVVDWAASAEAGVVLDGAPDRCGPITHGGEPWRSSTSRPAPPICACPTTSRRAIEAPWSSVRTTQGRTGCRRSPGGVTSSRSPSAPICRRWSSPAPPSTRSTGPCSSTSTPARP